ncbi:MAG: CoA transferase [Neisseriales bacterium]|nr:MAG: CoA transferase [Neisseriales bacterium]
MSKSNPVKELIVIEVAGVLAGPAVGTFFAELGAKVIKLENPDNPDVTRSWKLSSEDPKSNISGYFCAVNYNKQYLDCNLNSDEGYNKFIELIKSADILISNFRNAKKLNLDYQQLQRINPRLIQANITGYGENNPRGAYDAVLQAESGLMSINGTEESGPIKLPLAFIDILAAHQLKEAILLALLKRNNTGTGSYVAVSLYEAAIASLANQATNWLMGGKIPKPTGSLHPNIAPYGETLICADNNYIVLAIGNDQQFTKLCKVLQISEIASETKYSTNLARIKNRTELFVILSSKFREKPASEWSMLLLKEDIPAGQIMNMQQLFTEKIAQAMILEENIDGVNTRRVKTVAFKTDFLE